MEIEDIIEELVLVIMVQEKEINELKRKIKRINQYIEFHEKLIRGEQ